MGEHKPPTRRGLAGGSVSISHFGEVKPMVLLIERAVSAHSHRGSEVTGFITYRFQNLGWGSVSQRKAVLHSRS